MSTILNALQAAKQHIEPVSDSASFDAQILLGDVLGVDRAYLLSHREQELTPQQEAHYQRLVERCAAGEPLAYIRGRRSFYDREFTVSPAVLVPRPETELLLEQALAFVRQKPQAVVVDVGTGSGALAVTLAALAPSSTVYAVDVSPAALEIARRNAQEHSAPVQFFHGDLLTPFSEQQLHVDLIMANLPYIAHDEMLQLAVSRHEPHLALDGGADGLDLIRRLLEQAPALLDEGGLILLEISADQGEAVRELGKAAFPHASVEVLNDLAGLNRVVSIARK